MIDPEANCYECDASGRKYTLNYQECVLCDDCAEENGVKIELHHPQEVRCDQTEDMFG